MTLPNLDDVPQLELAEDGQHDIRIISAREFESQAGRQCWRIKFRVEDKDNAQDFNELLAFPMEGDDTRKAANMGERVRKFIQAFGLKEGMGPDDVIDRTASAILGTKYDDYLEADTNYIRQYL